MALDVEAPPQDEVQQGAGAPQGDEATPTDPSSQANEDGKMDVPQDMLDALKQIKQGYKISWSPKRRFLVQRALKAYEFLKGNPYSLFQRDTFSYDPVLAVIAGQQGADSLELYAHNDNVYQMLALSYIAVGSNNTDKTRYMPDNPQEEDDILVSEKASMMMADIERRNGNRALQKLELLFQWLTGSYFSYVRNIVDADRAGTTKQPVYGMQDVAVQPNRFICPKCGNVTPEQHTNPFTNPTCEACNTRLSPSDWYPEERMQMPMQVDENDVPNSMTAINIYNLLSIDADPSADELAQTPILDLEGEITAAAVRASYPTMYRKITAGAYGSGSTEDDAARLAREGATSPGGTKSAPAVEQRGTYSRCWIRPFAYNFLEDEAMAQKLKARFPKGCKLVMWGPDVILEAVEEDMMEHWTWCPILKGLGLYPFGVGDSALSVQERINDVANNIHAYMDRVAFPNIIADVDAINVDAMNSNPQGGGQVTGVKRVKQGQAREPLSSYLWQPQFHIDSGIYNYGQQLVLLAQLLSGIQPQIFGGGTTEGVDTKGGQEQMLNTAMGRLMLFFDQIREEHAFRAKNAVKCMAKLVEGSLRIRVPGEAEGEWDNEFVLESEVQGEFHAYPEADQGFPSSYGEMRDRLQQLLQEMKLNPFAGEILGDPDNAAIIAKYLLPDGIKIPGASARTKIKMVLQQLSQQKPSIQQDPETGQAVTMPSMPPDKDFDDLDMILLLAKSWAQENYKLQQTNPLGFENVRAYFKLASQYNSAKMAAQAMQMNGQMQDAAASTQPPPQGQGAVQ